MTSSANLSFAIKLMQLCVADEMEVEEFCSWYERFWNFELERTNLSDNESRMLETLFNEVALFVTAPRSSWEYPRYRDEVEIRKAVGATLGGLSLP